MKVAPRLLGTTGAAVVGAIVALFLPWLRLSENGLYQAILPRHITSCVGHKCISGDTTGAVYLLGMGSTVMCVSTVVFAFAIVSIHGTGRDAPAWLRRAFAAAGVLLSTLGFVAIDSAPGATSFSASWLGTYGAIAATAGALGYYMQTRR
jgi:hypothetical protein